MKREPIRTSAENGAAKRWPLAVHIVYERIATGPSLLKEERPVEQFANNLYLRLSSGDRSPRVPVRHWSCQVGKETRGPAPRIPLEHATRNVVVVLVDQVFFERRGEWDACIKALVSEIKSRDDIIIPVAIEADAARVAEAFSDVNHIVARKPSLLADDERIFQSIYTAILRLLVEKLPKVFLCHAKADGTAIARKVRQYLYEETQLICFFDMHDIPHGHAVKQSIESAIGESVVLAIWTDRLLESPWCQFEIIEARRQQRPMVVLDALVAKTPRLFPFLGNMPVIRWRKDPSTIVSAILLELIRTYHLRCIFTALNADDQPRPTFGLHPPDLLDSSFAHTSPSHPFGIGDGSKRYTELFVYPDPPLKPGELEVLCRLVPQKRFLSLAEWQALRASGAIPAEWNVDAARPNPFKGKRIGISVSPADNWAEMGLVSRHQDDLTFDIALQLILLGTKIVWGGDLRPDGLGSQLKWIVQTYQHPTHPPQDHVAMFVPYSPNLERRLDSGAMGLRRLFADVRVMDSPFPLDKYSPIDPASPEGRAVTAFSLSRMREELAQECHARILLGGGLRAFQGLYPGIAEEAYESVKLRRPIYIIGGFGGAAKAVYEAIANPESSGGIELIRASHEAGAAANEEVRCAHLRYVGDARKRKLAFDPETMVSTLATLGLDGLSECNGLSVKDNERLSCSQDIHELLELVMRGLKRRSF